MIFSIYIRYKSENYKSELLSINQSIYWRNETVYMTSVNKQSNAKDAKADEVCTNKCPNKKTHSQQNDTE